MKNLSYILILFFIISSCEDVIDIEVPNAEPRLVIDASLNWFEGSTANYQTIKLSLSAPFFDSQVPPATGANVLVTDQSNNVYNFLDTNSDGIYECFNFNPQLNQEYTLTIIYNNEIYVGFETMTSVTSIDFIEQNDDGGFTGDEIEIKAYYTDPADEENYYFFEFQGELETNLDLNVYDDEFVNGNQIFAFYSNEDTEPGNNLIIRNYGISKQFYEFMFLLLQQTSEGGGPFEVQPATVRGNCINQTNPENFPFGYFRASQATEVIYTVE
ncbi:DUF4249 domain-containing protein [Lacinutrix jangbogonensis]|uniref:DUF4249 domain-containing protein n=1 Tax=Lacinutrix jangbogonensis TaxID=1469557 RepID=UPI00053ED2A1|nr:DUF4249 domain-containing protein [Lacinutrix jangbogonensis]